MEKRPINCLTLTAVPMQAVINNNQDSGDVL